MNNKESILVRMQDSDRLSAYKLQQMEKLIFRRHYLNLKELKSYNVTRSPSVDDLPDAIFGADPNKLETVKDKNGTLKFLCISLK